MNYLKRSKVKSASTLAAVLSAALLAQGAEAATISGGLDFGGLVTRTSTNDLDGVDFVGDGQAFGGVGDFSAIDSGDTVTLTDITFSAPGEIWSIAGFSFTASSFTGVELNMNGGKDFVAQGTLTKSGFDPTPGLFFYSSNRSDVQASFSSSTAVVPLPAGGLMLLTALGGLAVARRKRKAA